MTTIESTTLLKIEKKFLWTKTYDKPFSDKKNSQLFLSFIFVHRWPAAQLLLLFHNITLRNLYYFIYILEYQWILVAKILIIIYFFVLHMVWSSQMFFWRVITFISDVSLINEKLLKNIFIEKIQAFTSGRF